MRIIVTGGGGFIGSHVVDALVANGHDVSVFDSFDPAVHGARPEYLNSAARYFDADITDEAALDAALRGADAVSHQAAMVGHGRGATDAPTYVRVNDLGTAVLLRAAARAGVGRIVLASSMVVYGEGSYRCLEHGPQRPPARLASDMRARRFDPTCPACGAALEPEPITEEAALDPRSVYAATKVHQEHLAFAVMRSGGPPVTALRYHNAYGPRMPRDTPYAGVASTMRSETAAGRPPRVFEDGRQLRDFVHVRDVARANVLALERHEPAIGAFNVGSGEPHTILDLAVTLSAELAGPTPVVTGEWRPWDVRHVFASGSRARRILAYEAAIPFGVGIREFARAQLRVAVQAR